MVGLRELTDLELSLVSGGYYIPGVGWVIDGAPDPEPYWPPLDNNPQDDGGDPGGGNVGNGDGDHSHSPPPDFHLNGRDCPVDKDAAHKALDELYNGSRTARDLMDNAFAPGVQLDIFKWNPTNPTQVDEYANRNISWDPFLMASGTNSNGSAYVQSSEMALAHEFVHAGNWNDPSFQGYNSEAAVMAVENKIASELNASYGLNYQTNRDNHVGQNSNSVSIHDTQGGLRSDCP